MKVVGLFAGVGGIEKGLREAGHECVLLCEIDPAARAVLQAHFEAPVVSDVRTLEALPETDVVTAGFPCQDLSQAGRTQGIRGEKSGLVSEIFRLLDRAASTGRQAEPTWLLLENVPFMLKLERGSAMRYLTAELGKRGFLWAYRVVDTRAWGLPQRRQRVILLASKTEDPRGRLFAQDAGPRDMPHWSSVACGFYWTEGNRGLGWAVDAVPTLKGGSTLGIPSPPAIWFPSDGRVITPDIRDAERLQGFPADWTLPATGDSKKRNGPRWRLVGNAVSVPVARWVGERLMATEPFEEHGEPLPSNAKWPTAAWGRGDEAFTVDLTSWPVCEPPQHLHEFLQYPGRPLSERATAGFLRRARNSQLKFVDGFLDALQRHLDSWRDEAKAS